MADRRRVLVGVCGSIAAYKVGHVVRELAKTGTDVRVVMTPSATRFVAPATFAALSENAVHTDVFDEPERVVHVELGRWAEAFAICGATASTIARLAAGSAEDVVCATYLMCRSPILVAPAMHTEMWEHVAVRRNVDALVADGVRLVPPDTGPLASGDTGVGRLADPLVIVDAIRDALAPQDLTGRRVLVTAGPTREPLDPVRYISNRSSGRMGFAIAAAARRRGADVTVVAGPTSAPPPAGVEVVRVETAQEMLDECLARYDAVDVVVKAAAVADWRAAHPEPEKRKKASGTPTLALEQTPDIAAELGRKKGAQLLVLFAAETSDEVAHARSKLGRKNADVVVANRVGEPGTGFDSETNDAAIVTADDVDVLPRLDKDELASRILDVVAARLRARSG